MTSVGQFVKNIYTIGHRPAFPMSSFIQSLRKYGVNCLVDIRRQPNLSSEYGVENLIQQLMANGICYLSFLNEFAIADEGAKRRGKVVYEKVINTQRFLDGVERLSDGIERGYSIVVLGDDTSPSKCYRNLILGRYLDANGWNVYHLLTDGTALSQKALTESQERFRIACNARKERAAQLGRDGEEIAANYLMQNGYSILDRNWNLHRGCELDIVAFKDNVLHAIEVKTRSNGEIAPEMAINYTKMKHLIKAFQEYRYQHFLLNLPNQIDSIAIVMKSENDYEIKLYEKLELSTTKFY